MRKCIIPCSNRKCKNELLEQNSLVQIPIYRVTVWNTYTYLEGHVTFCSCHKRCWQFNEKMCLWLKITVRGKKCFVIYKYIHLLNWWFTITSSYHCLLSISSFFVRVLSLLSLQYTVEFSRNYKVHDDATDWIQMSSCKPGTEICKDVKQSTILFVMENFAFS